MSNEKLAGKLEEEACLLYPLVHYCHDLCTRGELTDYDFAGCFVLGYFAIRRPRGWLMSRLPAPIRAPPDLVHSRLLVDLPPLMECLGPSYLERKLQNKRQRNGSTSSLSSTSVMDVFNEFQFTGIRNKDNYINNVITGWACGKYPCRLLFHVPSPMQVLRMQAEGERVVTLFTTREELATEHVAKLYYMEGSQYHSKDCLEFLLHDLKHMLNFTNPDSHSEQVGFFRVMLGLAGGRPKEFFLRQCGYDKLLWRELEYVISDMNCYVLHLLQYLLAKMVLASERKIRLEQQRQEGSLQPAEDSGETNGHTRCIVAREEPLSDEQQFDECVHCHVEACWSSLLEQLGMKMSFNSPEVLQNAVTAVDLNSSDTTGLDEASAASEVVPVGRESVYDICMALLSRTRGERTQPLTVGEGEVVRRFFQKISEDCND